MTMAETKSFRDLTEGDRRRLMRFINDCEYVAGRIRDAAEMPLNADARPKMAIHLGTVERLRLDAYWQFPEIRFDEKVQLETYSLDNKPSVTPRESMGGPVDTDALRRKLRAVKREMDDASEGFSDWLLVG